MSSISDSNGQVQSQPSSPEPGRYVNHRLSRPPQPLIKPKAEEKPVLDERLGEKDLMLSIEVKLHNATEKIADFKMERLLPEGKREENRWVTIKAVQDLIAAAREGTELKLAAKLGMAPQSEGEVDGEHDYNASSTP